MSSSSSCHFCTRANPAGSKFCNHCGEPLDLKPCKQCEAFNHVAVDRCYQCGTLFAAAKQEALTTVGTGAPSPVEVVPPSRGPVSKPARVEPAFDPLEHTPVALSDRMEAYTERVAEHVSDAPPIVPFAEADPEAETDDEGDRLDPRRQWEARLESRARRRARATLAAVAAVVVCAIAAGSYVAYEAGWLTRAGAWARAAERTVVASSSSIIGKLEANIGQAPNATPAAAPSGPAASDSTASQPAANPKAANDPATGSSATGSAAAAPTPVPAQPVADAPAPLATKTLDDTRTSSGSAAASSSVQGAAPDTAPPASRTASPSARKAARPARSDAARRPARETPPKPPNAVPTPAPVDKDALATQRLIQRDLAGFLPRDASSPPR